MRPARWRRSPGPPGLSARGSRASPLPLSLDDAIPTPDGFLLPELGRALARQHFRELAIPGRLRLTANPLLSLRPLSNPVLAAYTRAMPICSAAPPPVPQPRAAYCSFRKTPHGSGTGARTPGIATTECRRGAGVQPQNPIEPRMELPAAPVLSLRA